MASQGRKDHYSGKRLAGRHTTMLSEVTVIIRAIKTLENVRMNLNILTPTRVGERKLKFKPVPAGWELTVRGITGVQKIYVYTSHPKTAKRAIERAWEEEYE